MLHHSVHYLTCGILIFSFDIPCIVPKLYAVSYLCISSWGEAQTKIVCQSGVMDDISMLLKKIKISFQKKKVCFRKKKKSAAEVIIVFHCHLP